MVEKRDFKQVRFHFLTRHPLGHIIDPNSDPSNKTLHRPTTVETQPDNLCSAISLEAQRGAPPKPYHRDLRSYPTIGPLETRPNDLF